MSDVDDVKAQILQTRQELAQTTAALSAKTDVKARVSSSAKQHQQQLTLAGGAGALVVVLLLVRRWRKRRS